MRVLESAARLDLPDRRVAVCGDWHGNVGFLRTLAPAIASRWTADAVGIVFTVYGRELSG
nr:hypothetical protein GCM10025699_09970 [Microbacterium flavescens]